MHKESVTFRDYSSKDLTAADVFSYHHEWNSYREEQLTRWEEIDKYIHATDTSDFQSHFNHKTFIPVVGEIHEDLQAIMYGTVFPHNDWLGWQPMNIDATSVEKREKILSYLKQIHSMNEFKVTIRSLLDDFTRYGNCFGQVVYVNESEETENGTSSGYVGPKINRISPYDIVFNPTASSFEKTPKIIQDRKTLGGFLSFVEGLQAQGIEVNEEAVQYVIDSQGQNGPVDTTTQHKSGTYKVSGHTDMESYLRESVNLLWFYGNIFCKESGMLHKNRLIVSINGKFTLFDTEEPDPMIFKGTWKARPDNLWGQGPLDNIVGMNYMINHRENAKNDAIDRFIYPDRLYQGEVEEIYDENTNQIKYLTTEGGAVTDITPDASVLSFNAEVDIHEERCRRAARLPQQLAGFRSPGEKTAFEVQSLNDGAFRGFINKAEQFEQDVLERMVTAEIQLSRENYTSAINVMREDEEGLFSVLEVTEDDLKSNGKLIPYGARRFARLLQQQAGLQAVFNSSMGQVVGPHLSSWGLAQALEKVYGFEEFEMFGKFASVEEQLEGQQMANTAQQELVASTEEPTLEELEFGEGEEGEF